MREIITIQVGQCGNQIGASLLDLLSPSSGTPFSVPSDPVHFQHLPSGTVRARTVAVDLEDGVLSRLRSSPRLGALLHDCTFLAGETGGGGAGNNWARGYAHHSNAVDSIEDMLRGQIEACDSLQGVLLLHSAGGGTGSGLGSRLLEHVRDSLPRVQRVATCVMPSKDGDDVITSAYNALLTVSSLVDAADLVVPLENDQLSLAAARWPGTGMERLNQVAASVVASMTLPTRIAGPQNIDFSELSTNLVPHRSLNFAIPSLSTAPIARSTAHTGAAPAVRNVFDTKNWLCAAPRRPTFHAAAVVAAGAEGSFADALAAAAAEAGSGDWAWWNQEGLRVGQTTVGGPAFALGLFNGSASEAPIGRAVERFESMYKRRLYLHHFTEYVDVGEIDARYERVRGVCDLYRRLSDPSASRALARARGYTGVL